MWSNARACASRCDGPALSGCHRKASFRYSFLSSRSLVDWGPHHMCQRVWGLASRVEKLKESVRRRFSGSRSLVRLCPRNLHQTRCVHVQQLIWIEGQRPVRRPGQSKGLQKVARLNTMQAVVCRGRSKCKDKTMSSTAAVCSVATCDRQLASTLPLGCKKGKIIASTATNVVIVQQVLIMTVGSWILRVRVRLLLVRRVCRRTAMPRRKKPFRYVCGGCGWGSWTKADHDDHIDECDYTCFCGNFAGPPIDGLSGKWIQAKQASTKSFGHFECNNCKAYWASAHAFAHYKQGCKQCGVYVKACCMWLNYASRKGTGASMCDEDKPHRADLCEACQRGLPCTGAA